MNYDDDESNRRSDRRGQSEGSRRNRFSKENQPRRRRQRQRRVEFKDGLLEYLNRPVTVLADGQPKKTHLIQALLQSVTHDVLKAPLREKMRFLERLDKLGISQVQGSLARLDAERLEFEEEKRAFRDRETVVRIRADSLSPTVAAAEAKWYAAAKALRDVAQNCTCGACKTFENEDLKWALEQFQRDEEAERSIQELLVHLKRIDDEERRRDEACELCTAPAVPAETLGTPPASTPPHPRRTRRA